MICSKSVAVLILAVLVSVVVGDGETGSVRWPRIRPLNLDGSLQELSAFRETVEHSTVDKIVEELQVYENMQRTLYALCIIIHTHAHTHTHTHSHAHAYSRK